MALGYCPGTVHFDRHDLTRTKHAHASVKHGTQAPLMAASIVGGTAECHSSNTWGVLPMLVNYLIVVTTGVTSDLQDYPVTKWHVANGSRILPRDS